MKPKLIGIPLLVMLTTVFAGCRIRKGSKDKEQTYVFSIHQDIVPVLKNKRDNQVIRLLLPGVVNQSHLLTAVNIRLTGTTDIKDIKTLRLYYTGTNSSFDTQTLVATTIPSDGVSSFTCNLPLKEISNYLWLSAELNEEADLGHKLDLQLVDIKLNNRKQTGFVDSSQGSQRIGIALRKAGDDNVNTYRIPGMVTTRSGALIAVYDIRYRNSADLQGDIDVGMSRSTDGGLHWQPMQSIMSMGTYGGLPKEQNGIGDPSILVDANTGDIWVAALWLHGFPGQRAWNASRPGLAPEKTGQLMLVKSSDDGKTWSTPVNITAQVKDPSWQLCFQGPGTGITMQDGTLVFPAQFKDSTKLPHSTIIYSKDHGKSWHIGTAAYPNTTEAQVVETEPGTLMLNMRDNRGGFRTVFTTRDMGKSWTAHPTSGKSLVEPVCNASIIKHVYKGKTILFFVNPDNNKQRNRMTIKASLDMGLTWPADKQLLIDALTGNGYPTLTSIDENHLGLLYEGSQANLVFEKINIAEVLHE